MSSPSWSGARDQSFETAAAELVVVLADLQHLDLWMVTERASGDVQQVHVASPGNAFGLDSKAQLSWQDSFCRLMLEGLAPPVVEDALALPETAERSRATGVAAFASVPILHADGTLFGTVCGLHRQRVEISAETVVTMRTGAHHLSSLLRRGGPTPEFVTPEG